MGVWKGGCVALCLRIELFCPRAHLAAEPGCGRGAQRQQRRLGPQTAAGSYAEAATQEHGRRLADGQVTLHTAGAPLEGFQSLCQGADAARMA